MTVEELRKLKLKTEDEISRLLEELLREAGVDSVGMDHHVAHTIDGKVAYVTVKLRLNV